MIALAFFAGIFLTAAVAILIVRGAKAPHAEDIDWFDCRAGLPPPMPQAKTARDADFWDIANHEPEAGRVEYRFLGITGFEDD